MHHASLLQRLTLYSRPASSIVVAEAHVPLRSQMNSYVGMGMLGCSSRRLRHLAKTFLVMKCITSRVRSRCVSLMPGWFTCTQRCHCHEADGAGCSGSLFRQRRKVPSGSRRQT